MPNQKFNIFTHCNTLINILVIGTVIFALSSTRALAAEPEREADKVTDVKSAEKIEPRKMKFSIRIDDEKGIEIEGLTSLKEKLESIKSLKGLERLESLESLEKEISKLESLEDLKKMDITINDNGEKRSVGNLDGLISKVKRYSVGMVLIALAPFLLIFAMMFMFFYFRHRSRESSLATLRLLIEKGQPITPEMISSLNVKVPGVVEGQADHSHLIKGLKPIFWGIGITLVIALDNWDMDSWSIGAILIVIGLYHITKSYLLKNHKVDVAKDAMDKENPSNNSL